MRTVQYYRLWEVLESPEDPSGQGTWDTAKVEIPDDTKHEDLNSAVLRALEDATWPDGEAPVAVGYYGEVDGEVSEEEQQDGAETQELDAEPDVIAFGRTLPATAVTEE